MSKVTIRQVALHAAVSYQTVSNVINKRAVVTPETRQVVEKSLLELGYQPNHAARALASQRSNSLACVLYRPDPFRYADPYVGQVISGIDNALQGSEYELLTQSLDAKKFEGLLNFFQQGRIDGAILIANDMPDSVLEQVSRWNFPVVAVDRFVANKQLSAVWSTYRSGVEEAVSHLVSRGHCHIGFLGGSLDQEVFTRSNSEERFLGYQIGLGLHGLPYTESWTVRGNWTYDGGFAAAEQLLSQSELPTALIVANDRMAIGAMVAAQTRGLRIPNDLAVIGFDDFEFAKYVQPQLTTIHLPAQTMAWTATQMLLEQLKGQPERLLELLPTQLVIRGTT